MSMPGISVERSPHAGGLRVLIDGLRERRPDLVAVPPPSAAV
jgi:hypothetical protein